MPAFACRQCKKEITWEATSPVGFRDECSHCGQDLHICLHCRHYDAYANRECKETIPERVNDKEKRNFCELFQATTGGASANPAEDLLSAAEKLFKK